MTGARDNDRSQASDLLAHALAYAERGWPVFPVHTPQSDGSCSCRRPCNRIGKHPRISQGRNGATTDPDTIARWWNVWPDANIGIATGQESRLVVVDVDEDGEASLTGHPLPDTVEQITGSGGRHLIYQRPDTDNRMRTKVRILYGIDSRADGGYIVAPPSMHESGRAYQWEGSSDPFEGVAPAPAPQWFIDLIETHPIETSLAEAPEWNPDGELPPNIMDMLSAIPADEYETWRDVGMALHYTDPADGLDVWDWWSSTSDKYDGDAVRREWRNFSRRGHQTTNPITIATVRRLAEQHGWVDPDVEHGAQAAAQILESHQRKVADELACAYQEGSAPTKETDQPDVMPSKGLIREVAAHILERSVRPQPLLAVLAATAFVATLAGRKYQTETGLRTNLYVVGLAESGAGKDQARKEINNLAHAAQVDQYIGGDRIASGPGVISSLSKEPSRLFMIDEIGLMLQSMLAQRGDPHKREMMATLMTLYSSAGSVYRGAEYADQKERPRQDINNPNACIYGTSTHSAFYAALTSSQGIDGTLSRLIVGSSDMHRPARQRPKLGPPDTALTSWIAELASHDPVGGNLAGAAGSQADRKAQTVSMIPAVFDAWERLDDDMTGYMVDDASRSVYSRVAENAAKLALVHAVSSDYRSPVIDAESFQWGREMALWAANTMMREVARNVADNEHEADLKRVLNVIHDAGADGISQRGLLRKIRSIRKRDLVDMIQRLYESGEVVMEERKNKRGSPSMVFVASGG